MSLERIGIRLEDRTPVSLSAQLGTTLRNLDRALGQYLEGTIATEAGVSGPPVAVADSAGTAPFDLARHNG